MADVVNRTTKQYLQSVHTPDYPSAQWIINPDLSAVVGVPSRYWIITGDVVSEMSQAEKDALDAQIISNTRDNIIDQIDQVEDVLRQVVILDVGEFNKLRQWLVDFKAAVAASENLGQLKVVVAALPTLNQVTFSQVKTQLRNALGN